MRGGDLVVLVDLAVGFGTREQLVLKPGIRDYEQAFDDFGVGLATHVGDAVFGDVHIEGETGVRPLKRERRFRFNSSVVRITRFSNRVAIRRGGARDV